jgi:hypothetical protein
MKKIILLLVVAFSLNAAKAQIFDLKDLNLDGIIGKVLNVKKGWAPKFSLGSLNIDKIAKVSKIINLKNIQKATQLFNTFKTGRTIYKIGSYVGLATSTYSVVKNAIESGKSITETNPALIQAAKDAKSAAISKAQKFLVGGGLGILTGVVIKLVTKKAAYKATEAFNGMVKKKLSDILSFDAAQPSPYTTAGLALKIKL